MIVITVSNCPPGLRGYISRWLLEIDTGVFIGKANPKVREALWQQVSGAIRNGSATLAYPHRNEQGFLIETVSSKREIVNVDGMLLVKKKNDENDDDG